MNFIGKSFVFSGSPLGKRVFVFMLFALSMGCASTPSNPQLPKGPIPKSPAKPPKPIPKAEPKPPIAVLYPLDHLSNNSFYSGKLINKKLKQVMILPPSGTAGEEFNANLTQIERSLMIRGIEVTSPTIGARAVTKSPNNLSDLERALVLANASKVDAVLQIGIFSDGGQTSTITDGLGPELGARYLVYDPNRLVVNEVGYKVYNQAPNSNRFKFKAPIVHFKAKLIDVIDGTILANYDFTAELSKTLPTAYTAQLTSLTDPKLRSTSFLWDDSEWVIKAQERITSEIFDEIARTFNGLR